MATETRYFSDGEIRSQPDYMAYRQAVPQNTSADGNRKTSPIGKVQNFLDIVVKCYGDISVADLTNITIKLQSSSDDGVADAYADVVDIINITGAGAATTYSAGDEIGRYTVNTTQELYWKVVLTTTDAAATGSVNVFPVWQHR